MLLDAQLVSAVQSLHGLRHHVWVGVVVDCGHHLTHVVPLVEGYPLPYATQQFNVAGRDLTSWLAKTLTSDTKKVARTSPHVHVFSIQFMTHVGGH